MRHLTLFYTRFLQATGGGNRWTLFWAGLSLVLFVPAIFLPAMLVANAIDGAKYYSIWSSVGMLRERGLAFLAGIIFVFSIVFPLVKLLLLLLAASIGGRLRPTVRDRILGFTEWTSKYSMLDVYVMALLVLLVKVDQYVKMLPTLGLYLFCAAVLCGSLASGALRRAVKDQSTPAPAQPTLKSPLWQRFLPHLVLLASLVIACLGFRMLAKNLQGNVNQITVKSLTNRPIPRTFERVMGLKDLAKPEHTFFSRDTVRLLVDALQAATTDAGWQQQMGFLRLEMLDGQALQTAPQEVKLDALPDLLTFDLPKTVPLAEIVAVEFKTRVQFTKLVPTELTEERLESASDWSRQYHREWYGRVFEYSLLGQDAPAKQTGAWLLGIGTLCFLWASSGLVVRSRY